MKNKIYNLIFLLMVFFALPNFVLAATPNITNVSGTISSGQTLTVMGTNMVNENNANWVPELKNIPAMYGFEHNSDIQMPWGEVIDGYRLANNAAPMAEPPGAIDNDCAFTSAVKLSGTRSMKCRVAGGGGTGSPTNDGGSALTFYTSEDSAWYFRFYTRWNAVDNKWADNYMKLTFTMPANPTYNQWYIDLAGSSNGAPDVWYLKWSGSGTSYPAIPDGLKADRWYLVEGQWTSSPRAMKIWVDGIQIWDGVPDADLHNAYPQLGIINFRSVDYFIDVTNWTDNWAFSYTNRIYPSSTIEVSGDGLTWKYQEPVYLSDTTSQIKLDLTGLTGTNYQMRVTNNRQETSAIYNLSGGADMTAPTSPTGLSVL